MSILAAKGFTAGGAAIGIKESGAKDLTIIGAAGEESLVAAAVFTTNRLQAAPVQVSKRHMAAQQGIRAVVISSGNANAATGARGISDAEAMCQATAAQLGCAAEQVLVCSTGGIGQPLPIDLITVGIAALAPQLGDTPEHAQAAAEGILTTDTRTKQATVQVNGPDGVVYNVGGITKGAGMIAPSMATMLAFITTDAPVHPDWWQSTLSAAVDQTFNSASIDGCTSTNDTVIALASGSAGGPVVGADTPTADALATALTDVCRSLAWQILRDGEGVSVLATVSVSGATDDRDAKLAAHAIANSMLVKCSLLGRDPYWGRILSEAGASGASFNPDDSAVSYGGHVVAAGGIARDHDVNAVAAHMQQDHIQIGVTLGDGAGAAHAYMTDLGYAYLDENKGTS